MSVGVPRGHGLWGPHVAEDRIAVRLKRLALLIEPLSGQRFSGGNYWETAGETGRK